MASLTAAAQVGGLKTYRFLELPMSARAAGNGGSTMPIWGDDLNLIHSNPAALNPAMGKQAAFNFCNYVGDLKYYNVAHARSFRQGTGALSVQALNYGTFKGYDEAGNKLADFKAADYSINLHYAKPLADSMFNIGVALKTIISQYDIYSSYGNALDFGIIYHNKKDFAVSLLARNVGIVYKTYTGTSGRETLPTSVQLGFSKKVPKAPFRVFVVYDQLLKWNLNYVSPIDTAGKSASLSVSAAIDSTNFQKIMNRTGSVVDNFMRHTTIGTEIVITKNFNLRIAYNYRRQKEYTLPDRRGASFLSCGFNFRVKRFGFALSYVKMAAPGNSVVFGLNLAW